MNISTIIVYIMVFFMALAAIDRAFLKDKLGLGPEFEEGINAMGTLAMSMVGIMCLAPVLGRLLTPVVSPFYKLLGADPAMFAGTLLAIDMGGFPLASQMTANEGIAQLSGIILGSMMGATIVFSIPVSLGLVKEEDKPYLAKGIMAGMIAIPFGSLIGGLMLGLDFGTIVINLLPVFIIAVLLAAGLWFIPNGLLKGFNVFSKGLTIVIILAFAAGIIEGLTGLVVIPGMDPIGPQLETVGIIAITLAGAYPLVKVITRALAKPLTGLGKLMGVNDVSAAGMVAALANNIPMFGMVKDMDPRGKVLAIAFSVPAAFSLGDHLGYASGVAPDTIFAMIVSKIAGGIIAILIASIFAPKSEKVEKTIKAVKA